MDSSDDVAYLNYLSDKSHNFLLQSGDDGLCVQDPAFNSEPIFGELDDGNHTWTIGGLPVLLNAPIISNDTPVESPMGLESPKILPEMEQNEDSLVSNIESADASLTYPIEIPGSGFLTSNGLFLSNDVLLQLSLQNVDQPAADVYSTDLQEKVNSENSNDNVYEVDYECETNFTAECNAHTEISENTNISVEGNRIVNVGNTASNSNEIIQLLNVDGTVINVNKDILNQSISTASVNASSSVERNTDIDELIETIVAYKCKKCSSIFETTAAITKHVRDKHCLQRESDLPRIELHSLNNGSVITMKSILNTAQINKTPNQLVYLCSECDLGYSSTSELRNHMIDEHKLTNGFKSSQDEASKTNESDDISLEASVKQKNITLVKKQHKASKKVKCSLKGCDSRFITDEFRIIHEKCHVNGQKKQFKCPNCEKTFSMWRVCSLHLWRCHKIDIGLLTCTVCNSYKTSSPHNLVSHMSIHYDAKQYLCSECGKGFKQLTQLRNHQVLHLGQDQTIPPWLTQQKCDLCGNFYADSKTLKKHIQGVHNKFKPYVCNICGHKCARKAMLELHLRQHTGEKPYKCSLCSYSTGDHNSLRRHRMRHNGDTKYSCPHCDYQSIQTVAYKKHIATKHPGLQGFFCCLYCSFQTVNENIYTTHFKTHQKNLTKINQSTKSLDKNMSSAEETVSSDETQIKKMTAMEIDDEETQHGFLSSLHTDETVDTGGITIPAGLEAAV